MKFNNRKFLVLHRGMNYAPVQARGLPICVNA